jgi:chitinase
MKTEWASKKISTVRLAAALVVALPAGRAIADTNPVIAAYFLQWGIYGQDYHVTDIPADRITHILYAFEIPRYDSTSDTAAVVSKDTWADIEKPYPGDVDEQPFKGSFNQLLKLKARFPHIKTLISLGGWTDSDDFSDIAASSNARSALATACVQFMTNYGFDGFDLDWEYPVEGGEDGLTHRPEDADNYVLLVQRLRQKLDEQGQADGKRYLLTIAAPAGHASLTNRFHIAAMCPYLDWINVMTYDCAGPWDARTGHNAPLYPNPSAPDPDLNIRKTIETYLAAGAAPAKLVLGLPFYGRGFKGVAPAGNGLFQTHTGASDEGSWEPGTFDFKDLVEGSQGHAYINAGGFVRHWDSLSCVPYLFNPTSHVFITYDDAESVDRKLCFAQSNSLAGVMFWSVDADTTDNALVNRIHRFYYPGRLRTVPWDDSVCVIQISWHGWTGQVYTVSMTTNMIPDQWATCSNLVNGAGSPTNQFSGANQRITVTHTNSHQLWRCFYRVLMSGGENP